MLESMYLTLTIISFLLVGASLFGGRFIAKAILAALAMMLFGAVALSSTQVEVVSCTVTSCITQSFFYGENAWIFWGMAIISALLSLAFLLILFFKFHKISAEEDI